MYIHVLTFSLAVSNKSIISSLYNSRNSAVTVNFGNGNPLLCACSILVVMPENK